MTDCKARQYSDQMLCDKCGLQWDMNDPDPPECNPVTVTPKKKKNGHGRAALRIIKAKLRLFNE